MKQKRHNGAAAMSVPLPIVADAARLKDETADLLDRLALESPGSAMWLYSLARILRNLSVDAWLEGIERTEL